MAVGLRRLLYVLNYNTLFNIFSDCGILSDNLINIELGNDKSFSPKPFRCPKYSTIFLLEPLYTSD
jgi:hypothetical protein